MEEELKQREECDFVLYVITPKMTGVYSIAEEEEYSNKRPEKTLIYFRERDDNKEFTPGQSRSLSAVWTMVEKNGAKVFDRFDDIAKYLNNKNNA